VASDRVCEGRGGQRRALGPDQFGPSWHGLARCGWRGRSSRRPADTIPRSSPGVLRRPGRDDLEDRKKQLSSTAMHRWWAKCLERAELPHRPMHEARPTAITEFLRRTGNLKLAQMLAGHADIGTHGQHLRAR
jgi:integrase